MINNDNITGGEIVISADKLTIDCQLESTLASGTAPIVVASPTVATNLNADMLDGYHASDFTTGSGISSITIQDEGAEQGEATTLNFVGDGVTASVNTGVATITVSGGATISGDYLPLDGSEAMLGNLDMGDNTISNASSIETNLLTVTVSGNGSAGVDAILFNDLHTDPYIGYAGRIMSYSTYSAAPAGYKRNSMFITSDSISGMVTPPMIQVYSIYNNSTGQEITYSILSANRITLTTEIDTEVIVDTSGLSINNPIISTELTDAPFDVSSTELNVNLNADMLDGYHASDFALSSGISASGYLPLDGSGTMTGDLTLSGISENIRKLSFIRSDSTEYGSIETDYREVLGNPYYTRIKMIAEETSMSGSMEASISVTNIDGPSPTEHMSLITIVGDRVAFVTPGEETSYLSIIPPSFSIQNLILTSQVTTGTAPFSITSTTVNTNLNADLLDGYHATDFVAISGYTDALVLGKVKNVDGEGSSLDADLLDGYHATDLGLTGWTLAANTWTYASATTFTVSGVDVTATFPKGTKLKLTQTTVKYFYVINSVYSGGNTTVTLCAGNVYSLANAAITSPYYSYHCTPQGFPTTFAWTPVFTGFSSDPTNVISYFHLVGNVCYFNYYSTSGTSNAAGFTMTLPIVARTLANANWNVMTRCRDNSTWVGASMGVIASAGTVITFYKDVTGAGFTTSNTKNAICQGFYEI